MADAKQAIEFVMRQEDAMLSGVITNRPGDRGGLTRFGLTARWHPELQAEGFFSIAAVENGKIIPRMKASEAFALAEQAYKEEYADPLALASINSQAVAVALLSLAVLEGKPEAVTLLQKAILAVTPGAVMVVDGLIGPRTLALVNAADPAKLRDTLVSFGRAYYEHLAMVVPSQAANLHGWRNRTDALLAIPIETAGELEAEAEPA